MIQTVNKCDIVAKFSKGLFCSVRQIVVLERLWTTWCTVVQGRQAEGNRAPGHPQHRGSNGFDCCPQRHENSCFVWCWWRITMTLRTGVPPPGCSKNSVRQHLILNIDRSKAFVPVLILFCVPLWFMLRGASCFKVFPCSLSSCFVIPLSIVITSSGEEGDGLCASRALVCLFRAC